MKTAFPMVVLASALLVAGCSTDRRCKTGQSYESAQIQRPLSAPVGMQAPANDQVLKIPSANENGLSFSYKKPAEDESGKQVTYCLDLPPKIPSDYR